jgi:hypothetical protein
VSRAGQAFPGFLVLAALLVAVVVSRVAGRPSRSDVGGTLYSAIPTWRLRAIGNRSGYSKWRSGCAAWRGVPSRRR